jgi:hypothetical protein
MCSLGRPSRRIVTLAFSRCRNGERQCPGNFHSRCRRRLGVFRHRFNRDISAGRIWIFLIVAGICRLWRGGRSSTGQLFNAPSGWRGKICGGEPEDVEPGLIADREVETGGAVQHRYQQRMEQQRGAERPEPIIPSLVCLQGGFHPYLSSRSTTAGFTELCLAMRSRY